ncbi:hypothetical protein [Geminisphaera colitermitum]|uniref:hypothetical protein n=1 Tax=Geminisphaera colitermitum TaxID=1148786 RepID=UPI0005B7C686|nr:hypothetical protein [Geminisphaera colitermitum]
MAHLGRWAKKMTITTKRRYLADFREALQRARALSESLVQHGRYEKVAGVTTMIPPTDRREIIAFIFLEVSAKFESFAYLAFQYDVCRWYKITTTRSEFVVGNADRGTKGIFGWAIPERLAIRGKNLLTKESLFGDLRKALGDILFETLTVAHELRNRVAHDPATASTSISKLAASLGVPSTEMKGLSVGRLLLEYPKGCSLADSYFHILLDAYEEFAAVYELY